MKLEKNTVASAAAGALIALALVTPIEALVTWIVNKAKSAGSGEEEEE